MTASWRIPQDTIKLKSFSDSLTCWGVKKYIENPNVDQVTAARVLDSYAFVNL